MDALLQKYSIFFFFACFEIQPVRNDLNCYHIIQLQSDYPIEKLLFSIPFESDFSPRFIVLQAKKRSQPLGKKLVEKGEKCKCELFFVFFFFSSTALINLNSFNQIKSTNSLSSNTVGEKKKWDILTQRKKARKRKNRKINFNRFFLMWIEDQGD